MQRPSCNNHPHRPAVARCASCGVYLCTECVVERGARAFCRRCAAGEVRDAARQGRPEAGGARAAGKTGNTGSGTLGAVPGRTGGPVGAKVVTHCAYHPGVRAVARCRKCGAFICRGCMREAGGGIVCETCLRLVRGKAPAGRPAAGDLSPFPVVPWKLWPGLAFLPVPFVLSGLMTYMMRQGGEVSVGAAQLLISLLLYSCTVFFAVAVAWKYGDAATELGLHGENLPASLGFGFLGGSLAYWLGTASAFLSYALLGRVAWVEGWLQGFFDINVKDVTGLDLLVVGLVVVVAAPVCEEIFFRGYLYPAMRKSMGVWGASLLNGFLFSVVHFSILGLLGRTLAGFVFCLLYEYNENLVAPITAHAVNNFVAFFLPLLVLGGA